MKVKIFDKTITVREAPVHIAPDGSRLIRLTGHAPFIAKFLEDLREEIAYGMIKAEVINTEDRRVEVWTYIGRSDEDEWMKIWQNQEHTVDSERRDLAEGEFDMGYSMATRNEVIEALK